MSIHHYELNQKVTKNKYWMTEKANEYVSLKNRRDTREKHVVYYTI